VLLSWGLPASGGTGGRRKDGASSGGITRVVSNVAITASAESPGPRASCSDPAGPALSLRCETRRGVAWTPLRMHLPTPPGINEGVTVLVISLCLFEADRLEPAVQRRPPYRHTFQLSRHSMRSHQSRQADRGLERTVGSEPSFGLVEALRSRSRRHC